MENHFFGTSKNNGKTILLIYDISDDRRRRKMAKLLEGYGFRVQESAFECNLTKQKYYQLINQIPNMITSDDNVRVYPLHENDDIIKWNSAVDFVRSDVLIC